MIKSSITILVKIHLLLAIIIYNSDSFSINCSQINDLLLADGCDIQATQSYFQTEYTEDYWDSVASGIPNISTGTLYGKASLKAFPANDNNLNLDKLLIVVSPYDPEGLESFESIILDFLEPHNLLLRLKQSGYDIIVVKYGLRGNQPVQSNSLALAAAIKKINSFRSSSEEYSILGLSLGGVMARYALKTLENEGVNHNIDTYISYDSPHRGANVPLSGQIAFRFLAQTLAEAESYGSSLLGFINLPVVDDFYIDILDSFSIAQCLSLQSGCNLPSDGLRDLRNNSRDSRMLYDQNIKSIAARQLLINHDLTTSHNIQNTDVSLYGGASHPARYTLMSTLASLGYPSNTRNIAFSNSAIDNTGYTRSAGQTFLNSQDTIAVSGPDIDFELLLYTTHPNTKAIYGKMRGPSGALGSATGNRRNYGYIDYNTPSEFVALDGAPGSYTNSFLQLAEGLAGTFNTSVTYNSFSFIPTISALDIPTSDFFINLQTLSEDIERISPFDIIYVPTTNQRHLEITQDFSNRLYSEITGQNSSQGNLAWLIPVTSMLLL